MTHDEYLTAAASGSLTPEQQQMLREHEANCPECRVEDPPEHRLRNAWWLATAAVLFLALWIWREAGIRVARERTSSDRAQIEELTSARDVLVQQKSKLLSQIAIISMPNAAAVTLSGPAGATGRVFVDRENHRAVLVASGLPQTGSTDDYQVWLYGSDPNTPRSGGLFDVSNGHTTLSIDSVPADLKSVSVTLEKNGGADKPGTQVVLAGSM